MRALAIILVLAAGCGGKQQAGAAGPPTVAAAYPAARWIPGTPSYVVAAKTMREAQRTLRDLGDTLGMLVDVDPAEISRELTQLLAVDPLSPQAVAAIGVDLDGGVALFSEDVNPTFVVHLSSPTAMQAFFDSQRQRGMVTQSVIVEGAEVFTTKLSGDMQLSWVVDADWLWVHFGSAGEGTAWFSQSKRPASATWAARWQSAQELAGTAGVVGFADLHALMSSVAQRTRKGFECVRQFEPVRDVSLAIEGGGTFVGAKLGVQLASAQPLAQNMLAPPPGWAAASAKAPLAAAWNLDLRVAAAWVRPCIARYEDDGSGPRPSSSPDLVAMLDELGVRSGRAFLHSLDPDDKSGTGAVALDLTHARYVAALLDRIPMRKRFEKDRTFGAYRGKHLSVPFVATADYVLDDRVFLAAMGDGLLAKATTGGPAPASALVAVDLVPAGLPPDVWEWLFTQLDVPAPKRLVQRLQRWNDIHLGARLDRERLVIEARANRR